MSLGGNLYALVVVDNFSRFTWTLFLHSKKEAYPEFKMLQKGCRTHVAATLELSEVIMEENFKMKSS